MSTEGLVIIDVYCEILPENTDKDNQSVDDRKENISYYKAESPLECKKGCNVAKYEDAGCL